MASFFTVGQEEQVAAAGTDAEPLEWHVSFHEGKIWLSDVALDELEHFTGRRMVHEHVRDVLQFLDQEAALLQKPTFSQNAEDMNFLGFAFIKAIRHAIQTKLMGEELAGQFPNEYALEVAFMCDPVRSPADTLH